MGEGRSNELHLRVQHSPVCVQSQVQTKYALGRLESVRVRCDVILDPPDNVVFNWYFNGSQPADASSHALPNGGGLDYTTAQTTLSKLEF